MVESDQVSGGHPWGYLLRTWRELDVPEGWRAEIDGGRIVLVPPPHAHHHAIVDRVQRRLYEGISEAWGIYQVLAVHVAALGKLYVPHLVVMPSELIDAADPEVNDPMDAADALLVVEV
ncbi:Uma2 family endonuclease, partial [Streptomyces mirabilis]